MDWWFVEGESKILVRETAASFVGGGVQTLKCLVRASDPAAAVAMALTYWSEESKAPTTSLLDVRVKPFAHPVLLGEEEQP